MKRVTLGLVHSQVIETPTNLIGGFDTNFCKLIFPFHCFNFIVKIGWQYAQESFILQI